MFIYYNYYVKIFLNLYHTLQNNNTLHNSLFKYNIIVRIIQIIIRSYDNIKINNCAIVRILTT